MSQENLDVIQQAMSSDLGELEWLDPAVEVVDHDIPDAGAYHGHEGFFRWMDYWAEAWSEFAIEPERFIDAGDRVVVIVMLTARGKGSGVEVKRRDAMVWTMRDGKAVRLDYYNNEAEALAAVDMS